MYCSLAAFKLSPYLYPFSPCILGPDQPIVSCCPRNFECSLTHQLPDLLLNMKVQ